MSFLPPFSEYASHSEIAITLSSDTASVTSKRCRGYREPNDAALTSQGFVNQIPAARRASPKTLSPTDGNLMFLDAVEIEPQIQFSGLEREATRMVRSPKAEILFQKCFFKAENAFSHNYKRSHNFL